MEFNTTLRDMPVTVCIESVHYFDGPDGAPYFEFDVYDIEGEELELTDAEVDEIIEEIIDFMDEEAEHSRGMQEDQGGW